MHAVGTLKASTVGNSSCSGAMMPPRVSVGMPVSGAGIPAGDTIATIVNGTSITLTQAATTSGNPSLVFSNVNVIQENAGVVLVSGRADTPPVPPGRPHVQDVLEDDNIMSGVFAEILKEAFDGGPVTAGRVNEFDEFFDVEQDDVPYLVQVNDQRAPVHDDLD